LNEVDVKFGVLKLEFDLSCKSKTGCLY